MELNYSRTFKQVGCSSKTGTQITRDKAHMYLRCRKTNGWGRFQSLSLKIKHFRTAPTTHFLGGGLLILGAKSLKIVGSCRGMGSRISCDKKRICIAEKTTGDRFQFSLTKAKSPFELHTRFRLRGRTTSS